MLELAGLWEDYLKYYSLLALLLLISLNLFSSQLVKEELYYDGESESPTARKEYIYNEDNNIIRVLITPSRGAKSSYSYSYEDGLLLRAEEFLASGRLVKYILFHYEGARAVRALEYNFAGELTMKRLYSYDSRNRVETVSDYSPLDEYLGKRLFRYENGRLSSELLYDEEGRERIERRYLYKRGRISTIEFYSKKRRLRVIKRIYSEQSAPLSPFGLRDNFWDLR